jgi:MYXO-CTERM domain-containing protein
VLYTLHGGSRTPTDGSGIEVDVALEQPLLIHPRPSTVSGTVVAVHDGAGATEVFFDHVILSATGSAAATVRGNVAVGDTIGISQELANYARDCSTRRGDDWTNAYASVAGWPPVLEDGTVPASGDPAIHPRTAVALSDSYVFFVVVDGRSGISLGMTLDQLGSFCRDRLGATWATNQDGGGSSTLWVNGEIKNSPSDGSERAVANGTMMVRLLPAERSLALGVDDTADTISSATLRLGPGDNYPEHDTVAAGTGGRVVPHPANGLLARGTHWWLCEFGGTSGWVDEGGLRRTGGPTDGGPGDADDAAGADADADVPVTPDSGEVPRDADGGRTDVPLPSGDGTGGCGCRTTGARGAGPFVALAIAVVFVRLRRRLPRWTTDVTLHGASGKTPWRWTR